MRNKTKPQKVSAIIDHLQSSADISENTAEQGIKQKRNSFAAVEELEDEDDYESDKEEIKAELKTETIFKCDSDDDDDRVRLVLCSEHIKAGKIFLSFINI